ncbi:ATP-binding protein [Pyrobaculum calidifontis]|uniref:AAA ATPase n=1 Tax=Pyrobaculum calidifontis (strain DSM 21063 / JCM 11548 / VA1) TaxID=410359 RepID=A3MXM6_PYRCJ|nr:DUF87 domain-containing protein [Pyrobaculum calidifontis]ABO09393.1 AAA ATPase [Pyrobaculum calidifontis JCM 11548]
MWELGLLALLALATVREGVFIGFGKMGPVMLPLDRHVVITGPTRSGKTTLAKKIIRRARLPAVVLDWHGEYDVRKVDSRLLKFNLAALDKKLLCELIGLSLNLTEASVYFLYRAIRRAEVKSLRDVITALDDFLVSTRSEVEMKAAIARRLEYIVDVFERGAVPVDLLFKAKRPVAVDLSKLRLYEEKVLVTLFIMASLYNYLFSRGVAKRPTLLLVVDEAQNVLKRGDVVRYLVFESAKYGLRVVLVTNEMPPGEILVHSNVIITKPHFTYNMDIRRPTLISNNKLTEVWIV